jgi:FixJ family two-component response regulator
MATEVAQQLAISIVDDDQSVREAAMDHLVNSLGFSAEAFPSTEAFLRSDALVSTSWLIADVQMPGMSGLELRCRLAVSGNAIPTILITACPDDRVQAHALKAGVVGYLTKRSALTN